MDVQSLIKQNLAQGGLRQSTPYVDTTGLFGGIEGAFRGLNLNTPMTRSIFVGGLVALGLFITQPEFAFSNGTVRPWSLIVSEEDAANNKVAPTMVPWYLISAGLGFGAGLLF